MTDQLKALLLAAGFGTRLRPLTDILPKCLIPINGRPLLGLWLERLCRAGVSDIVVNLHHRAALVRDYVGGGPFAPYVTLVEESRLLGTAGTLVHNRDHFGGGPVLLAHADNLSLFAPKAFAAAHHARPADTAMTMMTFVTDAPRQCGIVKIDACGRVIEFHEKSPDPPGNLASAAVYIVEPEVIEFARERGASDFSTEVLPHFVGRIHTFHNDIYHRDIGTLPSLLQAQFDYSIACIMTGEACDPWNGLLARRAGVLGRTFAEAVSTALNAPHGTQRNSVDRTD